MWYRDIERKKRRRLWVELVYVGGSEEERFICRRRARESARQTGDDVGGGLSRKGNASGVCKERKALLSLERK
eukprot:scaffold55313_cov31-Tisochrysis_lutea.AAC.1